MDTCPLESNLLVRLGITNKEDIVSNLLADLLKEESFLDRWLEFAGLPKVAGRKFEVKTRINVVGNIPDLAVMVGDATNGSLLVIENKILATEGEAQTERYSEPKTIEGLGKAFEIEGMTKDRFRGLYLSLHDEGEKDNFRSIRYSDLITWLQELAQSATDPVRKLLAKDLAQLVEFFHSQDWTSENSRLRVLEKDPCRLGKNFVAFQKIFQGALDGLPMATGGIPRELDFWRGSGQGHAYYGGKIETPGNGIGWFEPLVPPPGKVLQCTTHIEFQYALANAKMKLALHFETDPYTSSKKQDALFRGHDLSSARYSETKEKISGFVRENCPDGWHLDTNLHHVLQIAYAHLEVTPETTIKAFQDQVRNLVEAMIPVLDNAWKEVRS